uniref:CARD domain-containing protein n=1 Tax=Amphiprion percula TaxID=161767 RepID=A0A3P8TM05_AMPPE
MWWSGGTSGRAGYHQLRDGGGTMGEDDCAACQDDLCWLQLEDFRMLLIKTIDPSRITPYLRQCQVLINQSAPLGEPAGFSLVVLWSGDQRALLDTLQRTGVKSYTAFLESLELDYPDLYPTRPSIERLLIISGCFSDTAGESGLTQFLMSELNRLQRALQDQRRCRQQACSVAKEQVCMAIYMEANQTHQILNFKSC